MSNQQNEELKEKIYEEIYSMTMHDFHYLLEEKLKYLLIVLVLYSLLVLSISLLYHI